ncbi:ORF37 [black bullhead herpesvirus]|uniref:ORF37 n=1 Tax=black bullhead herpesvirus TaxID=508441 RepID=A0A2H5AJH0_9VIRU|nr:ORF37 [black bullhead herpesvirus]AUG72290.1 ORF37 [black bullhead herpesvirus]
MYTSGQQQQQNAKNDIVTLVFRDQIPYTPTVDDVALNNLIAIIQKTHGLKQYTIRMISGTEFWGVIRGVFNDDRIFGNTVSEMMNNLNLTYAIDDFCTKQLLELFPDHVTEMQHLAGLLSKSLGRTGFYRHLTETFKRHMLWSVLTNFSPVAYYPAGTISRADETHKLFGREIVDGLRRVEETVLTTPGFRALIDPPKVGGLLRLIPGIPPNTARAIGMVYETIRKSLTLEEARTLGVTLIELLRRQYSGYLPVVPQVDLTETVMLYVHELDKCLLMDKRGRVFYAMGEPISRSQPLSSPVSQMSASTMKFQSLFDDYMRAAAMNAKRTVVTAPQPTPLVDGRTPITRELNDGQISKNVFDNLIQFTGQMNFHRRTAVAEASGLTVNPHMATPTNTALAHMLRTNSASLQEDMLHELNNRIGALTDHSTRFTSLRTVMSALQVRNFHAVGAQMESLHPDDRELVARVLATVANDGSLQEPPEIHRLPENTKLLCSFTTNISLPEVEELLHLWTITWETVFCGRNLFTRRKHALQYTTTGKHENEPGQGIQATFMDMLNTPGVLMDRLYPTKVTKLTFTELMVLSEKVETVTLPEIFAAQIGLNPSEVRLKKQEIPGETSGGTIIATEVAGELGVDGRFI